MKVLVLGGKISQAFFGDLIRKLEESGVEYDLTEPDSDLSKLTEASQGHEAVITFYPLDAASIHALADSVRGVIVTSIGYDTIDVEAASRRGIMVCNIPDYSIEEVALHSVTLLLASLRNLCLYDRSIREGKWTDRSMVCGRPRHRLSTMTMGFYGFGRIGQTAAKMMSGFGVKMIAFDPYLPDEVFTEHQVERVAAADELYARSDIIAIYLILNKETYHLVDQKCIEKMKDGVILVNTARGAIFNMEDVTRALESGKIGAVGIDVWEKEPVSMDDPILKSDSAILTSHCAYYSIEANLDLRIKSLMTAVSICKGEVPYNCINKKALER